MSIRKMTFSLASLIFLIAFGLVFVTTPVIANDETGDDHKDAAADGTTADPATGHANPAGDGAPPQFKPGHKHPTAAITVKAVEDRDTSTDPAADPNMMVVDGVTYVKPGDGTNATQIPLRVTLSANIATGQEVASNELTITARRRDGMQVTTSVITSGGGTGALITNSMTVFDGLYLDIPADATGVTTDDDATTDVDESYLEVFVRVNTGAVLTPDIAATVDDQGKVVGPFVGVGNIMAAKATKIIIVNEFPNQRPTVTIAVPDTATVDAAFTATLTFSEAVSALAATDIMVMGGIAGTPAMDTTVTDGTVWTVEITPTVGVTSVEVGIMAAIAIGTAQTVTAATPPTVMIAVPDDATVDAAFTVTLTFSEAVSALAATDIMVTGGVPGTPAMDTTVTDGTVWTVEIAPAINATSVEVGVMAATATGTAQTVTATTPPTVMIMVPDTATVDAAFTVTLTFSKAVSALAATDIMVTGAAVGTPAMDTTVTDGTVWTVEITPTVGATSVEVGVMAATATGTAQTVTATTPEEEEMLEAGDYLVVVRDIDSPPNFGINEPDLMEWSDMPDLEELFDVGGTLQLKVEGATRLQVVFSEVMWAVDQGKVGEDSYLGEQWIELHNRTSGDNATDFAFSDIMLTAKQRRPALAEETDRISNVVGGGKDWVLGKGQNGNSVGAADGTGLVEFISMFRNNEGEPGHQDNRWSKSTELYAKNHRGTPGKKERAGVQVIGPTNANRSPIIFNEIGNHSNPMYEWIELKNVSGGNVNLKNYEVTIATTKGAGQSSHNDVDLIDFTGDDRNVPAGGILLVVKSDPTGDDDHPLAAGWNFGARNTWTPAKPGEANWVRGVNENSARYLVASTFNEMPDGDFVLILRNRQDRNGSTNDNNIRDVAGFVPDNGLKVDDGNLFTGLWPLKNFGSPWHRNEFNNDTVHRRQHAGTDGTSRTRTDRDHVDDAAFRDIGWTGIGYKRNAAPVAANGGTPGYADSADPRHHRHDMTAVSSVIVSEVMPSAGPRNLPEWIELFNTSKTQGVSVNKWRITITNHDKDSADGANGSFGGDLSISFTLDADVIPPNQPYLIVSRHGRDETNLPDERVHTVGRRAGQLLLNPYGFQIKVEAWEKDNVYHHVETVGNLGEAPANNRRPDAQSFEAVAWDLPATVDGDNNRVSLVRVAGMTAGIVDGMTKAGWGLFDMSNQVGRTLDSTYYGHASDLGSPGHSVGGVLPVSLSKFRPERMKDTGQIVIRWITESELNNAGFNILRSEKRDGEFTQINTKLIAGQGTTTERTSYEYADTSAKPNVVYYYQIQDVSFDGQVTTLRTTHLRGNVTAVGKATTTWGDIKALQ